MPAITAGVLSTSLASTSGNNVTIGEIVRYRIAAELPFDNAQYASLDLASFLPAGLNFVNDGSARIALVSNNGIISSLAPLGSNLYFTGDETNIASITPTFNLSPSILNGGRLVTFSAGSLDVLDNDLNTEYLLIEFNAVVTNFDGGGANQAGNTFDSMFQLFVGGQAVGDVKVADALTVVEPSITDMSKVATLMQFGNQQGVRYTISFTNTGDSVAYDVLVRDFIPAGLNFNPQSLQVVGGTGVGIGATLTSFEVRLDQVAVGATVTITYDVLFDASVVNGQQFTNTANIDYTSLPGANGEDPNPTGSVTPGGPGTSEGERDGTGGANDYFGAASAVVTYGQAGGATISGFVKCEDNLNVGINGVTIRLFDANGTLLATAVTASHPTFGDGYYEFVGLTPGFYTLVEDDNNLPAGVTDANVIIVGTINGVPVGTAGQDPQGNDVIANIQIKPGDVGVMYCFNEFCEPQHEKARISGFVFVDEDDDCIFDPGEAPIAGVRMELLDASGAVIAVTFTDNNGFYQFLDLLPGVYTVRQQPQAEAPLDVYDDGCDTPGTTGGTAGPNMGRGRPVDTIMNIPVQAGQHSQFNNFGEVPKPDVGQLSGFVFCDDNGNGRLDPGEHVFANARIQLTGGNLGLPLFSITDGAGRFSFTDLEMGTYQITLVDFPPTFIEGGVLMNVFNVYSATPGTINGIQVGVGTIGAISGVALPAGGDSVNNYFPLLCVAGQREPITLMGRVFYDPNRDCFFNAGDVPLSGVLIRAVATDQNGNVVFDQTTTTDINGKYSFVFNPAVAGGQYTFKITQTQPTGFISGGERAGNFGGVTTMNMISDIVLTDGNMAIDYDFCEFLPRPSKADFLANGPGGGAGVGGTVNFAQAPAFGHGGGASQAGVRFLVTGAGEGGGPHVRVFDFVTGREVYSFMAYSTSFLGGVRVASGDVTGDGIADIITAPGFGGGPVIRIYDGATGAMLKEFLAYDFNFRGGVYVTVGDTNGDGRMEIITGAGEGGGPHVKVFSVTGSGSNVAISTSAEFMAYDQAFRGGVRVAAANINLDNFADIITGAGVGGGPHVKVFNAANGFSVLNQFMAFDPTFRGGIFVGAGGVDGGDINGDGRADIVVGMGSGGNTVKVFSGLDLSLFNQFEAFGAGNTSGTRVGVMDVDGDGRADVIVGSGNGGTTLTRVVSFGGPQNELELFAPYGAFTGGAYISGT